MKRSKLDALAANERAHYALGLWLDAWIERTGAGTSREPAVQRRRRWNGRAWS